MNRRHLLKNSLLSAASILVLPQLVRAQVACEVQNTPPQTEGPFYPVINQVDTDADLIEFKGAMAPPKGRVILIEGHVQDQFCKPVRGALVEIWQACHSGRYNHPSDTNTAELDPNFQYWGKSITTADGFYSFRTIVPGAYPAADDWIRPPHIHYKVSCKGYVDLITQMYFAGEALNEEDKILQRLSLNDQKQVIAELKNPPLYPHPLAVFNIFLEKL